jgi:hypothetical protein
MTTNIKTKDLAMNDRDMCHCRIWCRETGLAGGQGGYEKACPQLKVGRHGITKSWDKYPDLKKKYGELFCGSLGLTAEGSRVNLCLYHLNMAETKGLQCGLITEERPTLWGKNAPHGKKEGDEIKWKCDPPDYSKTHGEHKYLLRDETTGKDLLRDKLNKKVKEAERVISRKDAKIQALEEQVKRLQAMNTSLIHAHYKMPHHMGIGRFNPETGLRERVDPKDPQVKETWDDWRMKLKMTSGENATGVERRRVYREDELMKNQAFNDICWTDIRAITQLIPKEPLQDEPPWSEAVDIEADMREMLFDMANSVIDDEPDRVAKQSVMAMVDYIEGKETVLAIIQNPKKYMKSQTQAKSWVRLREKEGKSPDWMAGAMSVIKTLPKIIKKPKKNK